MTELSDVDREMARKILSAWYGGEMASAQTDEAPEEAAEMLATARALVTAEILAAAGMDEAEMVEAMAQAIYDDPDDGIDCEKLARAAFAAIAPNLARLAAENAALQSDPEDKLKQIISTALVDYGLTGGDALQGAAEIFELMQPHLAAKPPASKGETVRVPLQVAASGDYTTVLASDGTVWDGSWRMEGYKWTQLPPLPQPAEVSGTVEEGDV
jgi:hypothetical protein